jgi:hypothetical protein
MAIRIVAFDVHQSKWWHQLVCVEPLIVSVPGAANRADVTAIVSAVTASSGLVIISGHMFTPCTTLSLRTCLQKFTLLSRILIARPAQLHLRPKLQSLRLYICILCYKIASVLMLCRRSLVRAQNHRGVTARTIRKIAAISPDSRL